MAILGCQGDNASNSFEDGLMVDSNRHLLEVVFELADGSVETHQGVSGDTLMDVALDNGVAGIKAQCGGGCTCCTCHCYVQSPWLEQLPAPIRDEQDMLVYAWGKAGNSRLACQVFLDEALTGIRVRIPAQQS